MRVAIAIVAALGSSTLEGCTSDEWPPLPVVEDDDGADDEDDAVWDGARLEVLAPASPSLHSVGQPVPLRAQVVDALGVPLPVDDIVWHDTSEVIHEGPQGDVVLPAGVYELSAVTELPNGDRLQSAVGGVRVQARWAGAYEGELTLEVEADLPGGGPLTLLCVGPLSIEVSGDGRTAEVEDGGCTMSAVGQTIEVTYSVDIVVYDAGLLRGMVYFAIDSSFGNFDVPIEWAGAFYDDRFSAGFFDTTVELPFLGEAPVSGNMQAERTEPWAPTGE